MLVYIGNRWKTHRLHETELVRLFEGISFVSVLVLCWTTLLGAKKSLSFFSFLLASLLTVISLLVLLSSPIDSQLEASVKAVRHWIFRLHSA